MLFGSTQELSSTWSVGQLDYGMTLIQTSNFSCTEPNAYIQNTLNKFLPRVLHVAYFYHVHTACFDLWNKVARKVGQFVFLSL